MLLLKILINWIWENDREHYNNENINNKICIKCISGIELKIINDISSLVLEIEAFWRRRRRGEREWKIRIREK